MRHVDVAAADNAVQRQQQRPVRERDSMSVRLRQLLPTSGVSHPAWTRSAPDNRCHTKNPQSPPDWLCRRDWNDRYD